MDVETCAGCSGTMRIIACIDDPVVIKAILAHLADKTRPVHTPWRPPGRAPLRIPLTNPSRGRDGKVRAWSAARQLADVSTQLS
jgi:hypothetical protein